MPDTQQILDRLLADTRDRMRNAVVHHHDAGEFTSALFDILTEAHTEAVVLGRHRAGDRTPRDDDDRKFAELVMREEDPFLANFDDDLAAGRYSDETGMWKREAILRRAELYLGKVQGTANEAWALTTDGPIHWRLGGAERHCRDCPRIAAGSPYLATTLPSYPRSGEQACLGNCLCWLEDEAGRTSFRP